MRKPRSYQPPLLSTSYIPTWSVKRLTKKVTGAVMPCHRPSQKPALAAELACALPLARQPDSSSSCGRWPASSMKTSDAPGHEAASARVLAQLPLDLAAAERGASQRPQQGRCGWNGKAVDQHQPLGAVREVGGEAADQRRTEVGLQFMRRRATHCREGRVAWPGTRKGSQVGVARRASPLETGQPRPRKAYPPR